MANTTTKRTTVPIPVDDPTPDSVWVQQARDSFEAYAVSWSLILLEFRDLGEGDPADYTEAAKQLGRPAADFRWRIFEGVFTRDLGA
ncbi:minor tail protein [Mycobacterium phage LaterM]|uniref:Minor tail protein n=1 Tax=Mycobacterium phage LaterM TaxID=2094136 RepID=A0A2P1JYY0_9CAUD|nr:minor tail protein [Mycobacterium phage LaterM]AVO25539.1 minor tail protein [Mycobacterium phage LaterM]